MHARLFVLTDLPVLAEGVEAPWLACATAWHSVVQIPKDFMNRRHATVISTLAVVASTIVLLSGCANSTAIKGFSDVAGRFDDSAKAGCQTNQSLSLDDVDDGITLEGAADSTYAEVREFAATSAAGATEFDNSFRDFEADGPVILCAISSDADHPEWEFERAILAVAPDQSTSAWVFEE